MSTLVWMPPAAEFISTDLLPLAAASLCAVLCAVVGNFLILRRQSMTGDAISHAVLPGLVGAFILFGDNGPWAMFAGAMAAGLVNVVLVELVRRLAGIEDGAAMGVVFTVLFALGVLMLELAPGGRTTHLDADCVLYGALEGIGWHGRPPGTFADVLGWPTLAALPREVVALASSLLVVSLLVWALFKELRLAAFDPELGGALGFGPTTLHFVLMLVTAVAVVASFEAVGSILVIAMLIVPPATARLLTDRLPTQIAVSIGVALVCAALGYWLAAFGLGNALALAGVDGASGRPLSFNVGGTMASLSGVLLALAALLGPRHGIAIRWLRRLRLAVRIARDDLLAGLYRAEEDLLLGPAPDHEPFDPDAPGVLGMIARRIAIARRQITGPRGQRRLTPAGREAARAIVRSHRSWEAYLVDRASVRADHVHRSASDLEHLRVPGTTRTLAPEPPANARDPHDRPIPGPDPRPSSTDLT